MLSTCLWPWSVSLLWARPARHRVVPPQPLRLCRCQCPEHLWYQFLTICPWSQSLHPSKDHTTFYYFGSAPTLIIIFLLWTCSDSYSFTLQSIRTQTSAPNFKVFGISPSVGGREQMVATSDEELWVVKAFCGEAGWVLVWPAGCEEERESSGCPGQ